MFYTSIDLLLSLYFFYWREFGECWNTRLFLGISTRTSSSICEYSIRVPEVSVGARHLSRKGVSCDCTFVACKLKNFQRGKTSSHCVCCCFGCCCCCYRANAPNAKQVKPKSVKSLNKQRGPLPATRKIAHALHFVATWKENQSKYE